ncbi:MAG: tRNA (adenosine(37)-N6)-threonylcarbamoyltransferase complex ATPase subunit type 1 TsaE [Candidatus Pacebacteria bacterium]|nr:tRNA (adenosine(37)-N6)-threonylcarbamoyltransferase complex ATPase subunit type 1 TsaE [Candidatus Paceibacterota bacterium]
MEYLTNSPEETKELGEKLAKKIKPGAKAAVICLAGELGAGKTVFVQGFAKGLGVKEKILSPTFVIMNRFSVKKGEFKNFYHFDCYRLESEKDLSVLEFENILAGKQNIICLEWPEKISKSFLECGTQIKFESVNEKQRKITIKQIRGKNGKEK